MEVFLGLGGFVWKLVAAWIALSLILGVFAVIAYIGPPRTGRTSGQRVGSAESRTPRTADLSQSLSRERKR
jgi:hypothetical protein